MAAPLRTVAISRQLANAVDELAFGPPISHVYNPLRYARAPHECYLRRYGQGQREYILLGMNPGPFGMAQTGVPFGDVAHVRDFLGISGRVQRPVLEHPKRPVQGFQCVRAEVSGTRLWGWVRERFQTPAAFFRQFFVANYCPLVFIEPPVKNRTPDKLPVAERTQLFELCDEALRQLVIAMKPRRVIGIGAFARARAAAALSLLPQPPEVGQILHPSPASPRANRGWAAAAEAELREQGVQLPASGA